MHVGNVGFHVQLYFWKARLWFQLCYKPMRVKLSLLSYSSFPPEKGEKLLCLMEGAGESVTTSVTSNTSASWEE